METQIASPKLIAWLFSDGPQPEADEELLTPLFWEFGPLTDDEMIVVAERNAEVAAYQQRQVDHRLAEQARIAKKAHGAGRPHHTTWCPLCQRDQVTVCGLCQQTTGHTTCLVGGPKAKPARGKAQTAA